MYVIVVGGGNTGSSLAELLLDGGQQVTVVEERPSVLEKLRLELPSNQSSKETAAHQPFLKMRKSPTHTFWQQSPVRTRQTLS